nr:MAG TPA: hypothetical protein [Caudoviricetes sp.]
MIVYVNGQILDSKKDDLIFLGFEDKEKELLLQNLIENVNTFAIYDEKKHNSEDIWLILQIVKKALEVEK